MKTNQLALFCAIIMIAFLGSCEKKCNCDDQNFTPPDGTFCYENNGRPGNMLKYKQIVKMLDQYDNTRKNVLEKALSKEDTRINFYSIQELKDYLTYMEALCIEKEIKLTGINIISAAYPKNYKVNPKLANYQTLIFMPTTEIDGEQVTFDPLRSKVKKPKSFKDMLAKFGYNWTYDGNKSNNQENIMLKQKTDIEEEDIESSGSNRLGLIPPGIGN